MGQKGQNMLPVFMLWTFPSNFQATILCNEKKFGNFIDFEILVEHLVGLKCQKLKLARILHAHQKFAK